MGDLKPTILGLGVALPVVAIITYVARIAARRSAKLHLAADDYCIGVALVLAIGFAVDIIIDSQLGNLGGHEPETPSGLPAFDESFVIFEKTNLSAQLLWLPCVAITKIGILLFYKRIFAVRSFIRIVWGLVAFCVVFCVAFFFAHLFSCNPIAKSWDPLRPGFCVNTKALYTTGCTIDVLTDIIILCLPVYNVMRLHMPVARKIGVISIFMLGAFVVASGIVRLAFVIDAFSGLTTKAGHDVTYLFAPAIYWTQIETSLGVVSANLPTLRPLFKNRSLASIIASLRSTRSLNSTSSKGYVDTSENNFASQASTQKNSVTDIGAVEKQWSATRPDGLYAVNVEAGGAYKHTTGEPGIMVEHTIIHSELPRD